MLIRPIQTEKAYTAQAKRIYMFNVPDGSSKQAVAKAVAEQYKVTVTSTRIVIRKGKATKFSRGKRAYPGTTYRQDRKIAYVTLKEGDKIKVFDEEAVQETEAKDEKKTVVKATDKAQNIETKKAGLFTRRRTGNRGDK
ncbi:MAG: 50S ribosomal protein L23 [Candidatus Nomurabacteria bacterium]|jgi:ribosomal protein L23|nr:50S ribosomal protein L23 [Candidatus Nomurabacteria bacterium]